jgi:tetrahedral aminopeptidase
MEELLRSLTQLPGPTGQEDAVLGWLESEWAQLGEVRRTGVGNLLLRIRGPGRRVLLAAHADELSLMVRSVTAEGFLRVVPGERDHFATPLFFGGPLRILGTHREAAGILATTTGHAQTLEQRERQRPSWDDVFVDAGLSRQELEEYGIGVGSRMVWDQPLTRVGRLLVGKALDDRAGLAVMLAVARQIAAAGPRFDVTFAATVQEEIGLLGAASLAREDRFDEAIMIDNGLAGDIPTVSSEHMPVSLGAGPALIHRDSSAHYSRRLIGELRRLAAARGIPVQEAVLYHYHSDGANLIRQGVETVLLAPPIRYSHSPFEALDPRDLEAAARLLATYLTDRSESAP